MPETYFSRTAISNAINSVLAFLSPQTHFIYFIKVVRVLYPLEVGSYGSPPPSPHGIIQWRTVMIVLKEEITSIMCIIVKCQSYWHLSFKRQNYGKIFNIWHLNVKHLRVWVSNVKTVDTCRLNVIIKLTYIFYS